MLVRNWWCASIDGVVCRTVSRRQDIVSPILPSTLSIMKRSATALLVPWKHQGTCIGRRHLSSQVRQKFRNNGNTRIERQGSKAEDRDRKPHVSLERKSLLDDFDEKERSADLKRLFFATGRTCKNVPAVLRTWLNEKHLLSGATNESLNPSSKISQVAECSKVTPSIQALAIYRLAQHQKFSEIDVKQDMVVDLARSLTAGFIELMFPTTSRTPHNLAAKARLKLLLNVLFSCVVLKSNIAGALRAISKELNEQNQQALDSFGELPLRWAVGFCWSLHKAALHSPFEQIQQNQPTRKSPHFLQQQKRQQDQQRHQYHHGNHEHQQRSSPLDLAANKAEIHDLCRSLSRFVPLKNIVESPDCSSAQLSTTLWAVAFLSTTLLTPTTTDACNGHHPINLHHVASMLTHGRVLSWVAGGSGHSIAQLFRSLAVLGLPLPSLPVVKLAQERVQTEVSSLHSRVSLLQSLVKFHQTKPIPGSVLSSSFIASILEESKGNLDAQSNTVLIYSLVNFNHKLATIELMQELFPPHSFRRFDLLLTPANACQFFWTLGKLCQKSSEKRRDDDATRPTFSKGFTRHMFLPQVVKVILINPQTQATAVWGFAKASLQPPPAFWSQLFSNKALSVLCGSRNRLATSSNAGQDAWTPSIEPFEPMTPAHITMFFWGLSKLNAKPPEAYMTRFLESISSTETDKRGSIAMQQQQYDTRHLKQIAHTLANFSFCPSNRFWDWFRVAVAIAPTPAIPSDKMWFEWSLCKLGVDPNILFFPNTQNG